MGLKRKVSTLFRALAVVALIFGIAISVSQADAKQDYPTGPIDFKAKDLDGKPVALSSLKGKVIVVDFWATWCPPCREEIPDMVALQKQYEKKGVLFVGVAMDDDGAKVVKPFYEQNHMNYTVLVGDDAVLKQFGDVQGFPTTFFVGADHKIHGRFEGFHSKADFEKQIQALLEGTSK